MSAEIPKTYEPASIEAQIYQLWLDNNCFTADPSAVGDPYCIVIPPPNVTGALHLGHAINDTLQDILIRNHRMRGFNALWVPGIDHAGIATQAVVEKQLKEKENKTRHDVGREGLVERIWAWKQQYGDRILEQLKRLGCSCDWTRTRFTLDDMCARAVRETFFKLFKDGLIYRGKRLVNWDVHLQTSISDDEIYHETVKTHLWHIRYPIEGTDKVMVVATTRPETMLGDTAVAVHSQDPRWNWAIGKSVKLPLTDRLIPIIADDILVDPKFGTGVVKVTPAHDPNDYAVWQRHQGKIDLLNIMNPDGTINQAGGKYAGMKRDAARKKVVEDLTQLGLLEKEEPYETQVGHSDRSKTAVEPYLSDQWFVKMAPLAEPALQVVRDGTIKFFPERHAQQYLSWLGEKRDWPISRQLWWGHRIPVWTKQVEATTFLGDQDLLGYLLELSKNQDAFVRGYDLKSHRKVPAGMEHMEPMNHFVCLRNDDPKIIAELETRGFVRDSDVLDTWFSSALWPHSTLGWPDDTPDLGKWYPTRVLVTGRDIITLWVARMVMAGLYNMGKIPFHHVAINPTILDGKGERMSKSKGNGVDPVEIIEAYGADALRFTLTMMATETQDVRMPVKKDSAGRNTSEKFDIGRNFCNKLWNAARFVTASLEGIAVEKLDRSKWNDEDHWIMSRLMRSIREIDLALDEYRFDVYGRECYDFFWRDFCDWYVEGCKLRLRDENQKANVASILRFILDSVLALMHPMIPHITESIWRTIHNTQEFLMQTRWPVCDESLINADAENSFKFVVQDSITTVRNVRSEQRVDQNATFPVAFQPPESLYKIWKRNEAIIGFLSSTTASTLSNADPVPPNSIWASTSSTSSSSSSSSSSPAQDFQGTVIWGSGANVFFQLPQKSQDEEKVRLAKLREEWLQKRITLEKRLSNESYTAKAPPHLVKQTQDQLAAAQAELAKIEAELTKL